MRRHSLPPTWKQRLLTHMPVILRFFSSSLSRVKCSIFQVKRPWYTSPPYNMKESDQRAHTSSGCSLDDSIPRFSWQ